MVLKEERVMKNIKLLSLISLLSLPVFAGDVDVKNCLKVNNQKVCFPDNKELFNALKDEKNESKQKKCFKNFMKNRLLSIKLKDHGLYYFQAERHQGAEIAGCIFKANKSSKNECRWCTPGKKRNTRITRT